MKRLFALVPLALMLEACPNSKECPPPAIEQHYTTVTKEVAKPCPVKEPARPAALQRPLPTDAVSLAALLGAKLLEYAGPGGYADRAHDAIETCNRAGTP